MAFHVFYKTSDQDRPKEICDRNGEVVLACCKLCGRVESELDLYPFCDANSEQPQQITNRKAQQNDL